MLVGLHFVALKQIISKSPTIKRIGEDAEQRWPKDAFVRHFDDMMRRVLIMLLVVLWLD